MSPTFARTIGINYSGAETPPASLKGLRVYLAEGDGQPVEVLAPPSSRNTGPGSASRTGWSSGSARTFPRWSASTTAFPSRYAISRFTGCCPTGRPSWTISAPLADRRGPYLRRFRAQRCRRQWRGAYGKCPLAAPDRRTRGRGESGHHFDVQGQVAKSTHSGIPWLRCIRQRLGARVHFWPFDGWDIPVGRSAIAEVYPALWSRGFARDDRTGDQHDAFTIAAWLWRADRDGSLAAFLNPDLSPAERTVAQVEGWILGVPGLIRSGEGRDASATPNACAPNVFRLH